MKPPETRIIKEAKGMNQDTGYWVECVPVRAPSSLLGVHPGLYRASIGDFPHVYGLGLSPDRAITKLKRRLAYLHAIAGEPLPPLPQVHNRLRPPQTLRGIEGWMSVYLDLAALGVNRSVG